MEHRYFNFESDVGKWPDDLFIEGPEISMSLSLVVGYLSDIMCSITCSSFMLF